MSSQFISSSQIDSSQTRPPLVRRYNVERSCIRCHERKVRCNKAVPCSACTKVGVQCRYPGPEKTKRRSQKGKQSQLYARLDKLERALRGVAEPPRVQEDTGQLDDTRSSEDLPSGSPGGSILQTGNHNNQSAPSEHLHLDSDQGFLVKDGTTTRYINEALLSQVLEKESELQSAIGTPNSASTLEKRRPTFGIRGLISNPCISSTNLSTLYPTKMQATRLWHVWLNNVNPIVRLLHIPTTQPLFFAAVNNPTQTSADFSALIFSIYFAAVTSIDDSETYLILGQDRQSALNAYQCGLELSLHMADFLDYPTIASIQAMSMYLMCHRSHNSGRSGWVLNGLVVRASQCIGLHRDGEHFKLSPLECEIRRRLWWHVMILDGRVAEDHGIITGGYGNRCFDTKLPLNINDTDLTADMEHPPKAKEGPTEISLSLVSIESNRAMQELHHVISQGPNGNDKVTRLKKILKDVKERMQEKYLQYFDTNVPIQRYAFLLGQVQIVKMEAMVCQQYLKGRSAENPSDLVCNESLTHAIKGLEICILMKTDELSMNYQWLCSTYIQYSGLTHVLWSLCVCPQSESAERAWSAVERSFELEERPGAPELGQKWSVLRKLRDKALSVRHALGSSKGSVTTEFPNSEHPQIQTGNIDEDIYNIAIAEGLMLDLDFDMIAGLHAFSADHDFQDRGLQL
ncbi:hypothetical protein TMatcc_010209 [Talaromyces marneffei ATCC 18224]|uniref:C6 transcription factor, putative n=2 Tax=Talaromyces marneffei TaxID=37727 RepID=B6QWA6_TALMQ|nr:C6 transcription factor, putative [Talaromyces marneffei ATCC 18224]